MRSETEAALAAVDVGLDLARRRVGADQVKMKGLRDLVTATDVAVEDAVRAALGQRFPEWTVVGEERGGEDLIGDRPYWLVDPICGTQNFAANLPLYCVNVALVEGGKVTVAAVGDGGTGDRFYAERGAGAFQVTPNGPVPLQATDASLVINISPSAHEPGSHVDRGAAFTREIISANRLDIRIIGSTVTFAYVAAGRIAATMLYKLSSPLHTAAGCLLAEEAGAQVTDHFGEPWTLETQALLVSGSPSLHADLLALLAACRG
jgi:myo-inositol-1(or 4)-monophosphatase